MAGAPLDGLAARVYIGRMADLSVSVSEDLHDRVRVRVAHTGYADTSEYLRELIERDQAAYEADVRRVQALIDEGIASGIVDEEPEEVVRKIIAGIPING